MHFKWEGLVRRGSCVLTVVLLSCAQRTWVPLGYSRQRPHPQAVSVAPEDHSSNSQERSLPAGVGMWRCGCVQVWGGRDGGMRYGHVQVWEGGVEGWSVEGWKCGRITGVHLQSFAKHETIHYIKMSLEPGTQGNKVSQTLCNQQPQLLHQLPQHVIVVSWTITPHLQHVQWALVAFHQHMAWALVLIYQHVQ